MAAVVRSASDFTNPPNYEFPSSQARPHASRPREDPNRLGRLRFIQSSNLPPPPLHHGSEVRPAECGMVNMCTLGAEDTSTWLMVDHWEAFQDYQRTAVVLDHFDYHINTVLGGARTANGEQRNIRIMLLAGSDLISTMSEPGVWSYSDLDHILGRYGTFIVERAGSGMDQATDSLARWRNNIHLISQLIQNDVSSTKAS
ncbi:MFS domain-containing protein [Mycena sanguinolenta]|uniref:MFS domain-containing protein n=1 Tax=Mycena sanguinolenta TaxID=230812 RepID=A0A8H7CXL6_9AGAR|nr:MFS domain-containing protein [Mycena sanguinolenta]